MNRAQFKQRKLDYNSILPFLLITIFGLCILFVLLFGAKLYKEAVSRDTENFEVRIINQYIFTRIHQSDGVDMAFIGDFENATPSDSGDTLFIKETINGQIYYTRIYSFDGALYELFSSEEDSFERCDGEIILPIASISFTQEEGLITVSIEHANGKHNDLSVFLRNYDGEKNEK